MLIDASVLIPIFRDKTGGRRDKFKRFLRGREYVLSRFTQIELLQGCKTDDQWELFADYLQVQDYLEMSPDCWASAARIKFDAERKGFTVRSVIDCCIAQLAIENRMHVVHNDNDFEVIEKVRKIKLHRLDIQAK